MTNQSSNNLLSVRDLKTYFRFGDTMAKAVDGVSFDIKKGQTFAIVGESGCGKSMTALSILRLVPKPAGFIAGGSAFLEGRDLTKLKDQEMQSIRGKRISMIFQEPMTSLNPVFTIGFQIAEAIRLHQGLGSTDTRKKSIEMLDKVGIPDPVRCYGQYPHELSGGMKQRAMIAIALSCHPDLLIADEPTTALDVTIQEQILQLIRSLQKEMGMAVLLITHNLGIVYEMADEVGVMYAGKMVEKADKEALFSKPLHPYTVRLFESLPARQKRGQTLSTIEGTVPKATRYPSGCRFSDRCHKVMEGCERLLPKVLAPQPAHEVACHLYDDSFSGKTLKADQAPKKLVTFDVKGKEAPALLRVDRLKVHFPIRKGLLKKLVGHVKAVDGVSFQLRKGETLALVGESGCGKTTLGKSVIQLIRPTSGSVWYEEQDLTTRSTSALRDYRRRMQIIFQDPYSSLDPRMMVGEILQEGMAIHGLGRSRVERERQARELMGHVGMDPDMIYRYPHEFSGGQRQRIGIARALSVNPAFLVCDEATSALDVSVQAQILNLLKQLQQEFGLTYLFITHDLGVVEYLADRVAVMYLGRIVEEGTTQEVFEDPKHPYTRALLSAVPQIDPKTQLKKIKLEGDVPSPSNPPRGCHFHPRCSEVMEMCRVHYPGETRLSETRTSHCFLFGDAAQEPAVVLFS